jgi:hypothetical protein
MSRISRFVVLVVGLMSLFAIASSSAGAVTWHNFGDTAYTASGVAGTLGVTGVNLACAAPSATGVSPSADQIGNTVSLAHGAITFTSCTLSGIPTSVHCTYTLTGTALDAVGSGTVTGDADISCGVVQFGSEVCRIEGAVPGSYTNPTNPSTFGKIDVPASSALRTTNGAAGSCPLGVNEPSSLTSQTFTITSATGGATTPHLGPRISRTA